MSGIACYQEACTQNGWGLTRFFTSQYTVRLGRHGDEGHRIPVGLLYEIGVKLSCPIVGYVLFFLVFGTNRTMNMMAELMEEDMAKKNLSEKKGCWHFLN